MDFMKMFQNVTEPQIRTTNKKPAEGDTERIYDPVKNKLAEVLKEKEQIQQTLNEKDTELTKYKYEVEELRQKIINMSKGIEEFPAKEKSFMVTISSFEKTLSNIMSEHQVALEERDCALRHLANVEIAFRDLLEKYERAKTVIHGFQKNEMILKEQLNSYEKALKLLEEKYSGFKADAVQKLGEAAANSETKDKKHIAQMAKLKAKILQSQVKITDLEKKLNLSDANLIANNSGISIFTPLKNLIK